MSFDPFEILGLDAADAGPGEIASRFRRRRAELLALLHEPMTARAARIELDDLYLAERMLRDPETRRRRSARTIGRADALQQLRDQIAASIEGGLIRSSRRHALLEEGRSLGLSEFHVHLLIAETQFGGRSVLQADVPPKTRQGSAPQRIAARMAAVGVLTLAMVLSAVRWLGV